MNQQVEAGLWLALAGVLCCAPFASGIDRATGGTSGATGGTSGEGISAGAGRGGLASPSPAPPSPLAPPLPPAPGAADPTFPPPAAGAETPPNAGADAAAPQVGTGGNIPAPRPDAGAPPVPPLTDCAGLALRLDGASLARLPNPVQDDFTLEAWIKTTASRDGTQHFQGLGVIDADVVGDADDFATEILNGRFAFGVGNPDITLLSTSLVITDEWVHVAATRRASTGEMAIVVNGLLESSGTSVNQNTLSDPEAIALGGASLERNFIGLIDEVRIWNVARSPETIQASMRSIVSPDEPGLVGYYRFEDAGSVVTEDSSLRSSHAALIGAPAYEASSALCPSP